MELPIYMWPMDASPEQHAAILRDQYQGAQFTELEVAALDGVAQLSHVLGSLGDRSRPTAALVEAEILAVKRGWLINTSLGLEPTIAGQLTADELREQAGFSRRFEVWEQVMSNELNYPSNFLPEVHIPVRYVLGPLDSWEAAGVTNKVVVHDGYCYPLLAFEGHFEQLPAVRFATSVVADLEKRGLIETRDGGLYVTVSGRARLVEFAALETE